MDWTPVYVAAGALLNALILGIWKPWGAAYAGEKGKNFARKEDLDQILAEVRAVTITQKKLNPSSPATCGIDKCFGIKRETLMLHCLRQQTN
jgi:hypothetical protein